MARSTSRLSESEREQRRARDREQLQHAAEELLTSEGWERVGSGAFTQRAPQVFGHYLEAGVVVGT